LKIIEKILALAAIVLFISSCDLLEGDTYNNAYAQEWFSSVDQGDTHDIAKLDLSDQSFEVSEATLDDNANLSEYTGSSRGSITVIDSNTLKVTIKEKFVSNNWYSREDYIELQIDFGKSDAEATADADALYIDETFDYLVNENSGTLLIEGTSDFAGTYHEKVMDSIN
jgi:hypothetical protein